MKGGQCSQQNLETMKMKHRPNHYRSTIAAITTSGCRSGALVVTVGVSSSRSISSSPRRRTTAAFHTRLDPRSQTRLILIAIKLKTMARGRRCARGEESGSGLPASRPLQEETGRRANGFSSC